MYVAMNRKAIIMLLAATISVVIPLGVLAHVGIGEYAGTHAVSLVAEPRSPFVGEEVSLMFYLKDLYGNFPTEFFITSVIIQELTKNNEEHDIVALVPDTVKDGVYETTYSFSSPGLYRIEFSFGRPHEPDIIREVMFDIEARDSGYGGFLKKTIPVVFFLGILIFLGGILLGKFIHERRNFA